MTKATYDIVVVGAGNAGLSAALQSALAGRKTLLIPGIAWLLKLLSCFTGLVNKAFGSLVYEEGLGDYRTDYRLYTLAQSIKETEAQR